MFILLLCMFNNGFAESKDATFAINVCAYGNTLWAHDEEDETVPNKKPKHAPSNKEQRILVEVFFNDAFEDIRINIFKDSTKVVYEDGIVASPEEPLQYDLTSYGHGSYYICIMNGSAVLYDGHVEL